jgi:hypothetical protein
MSGTLDADRLELLDAALAAVGPAESAERARLLALKATELSWHPDHHQRKVLAEEALAMAERLQDPATIVGVLTTRFVAIHHPDTLGERLASCQRARGLAVELDDPVLEFWASIELTVSAIQAGDRNTAESSFARSVTLADRLDIPGLHWVTTFFRAEMALMQGDPESGERLANEAFTLGDQTGQPDGFAIWANQIAEARYQQGRDHEIVDVVEEVVRTNPGVAAFRTALAACYCDLGRHDDARRTIEPDLVARFSTIGQDIAWLAAVISAADAVYGIGDERGAEALLETLLPYTDQYEFVGVSSAGAVGTRVARLLTVLGRDEEADRAFTAAAALCLRLGAQHELARLQLDHGNLLLRQSSADDRARGEQLVRSASATAAEFGYGYVLRDAGRLVA